MGRGVALQAQMHYPDLPAVLGRFMSICMPQPREGGSGMPPVLYLGHGIFSFPVKFAWHEKANLMLIERSCIDLVKVVPMLVKPHLPFILPRPGCSNGGRTWVEVKPILERYLKEDCWWVVGNEEDEQAGPGARA